MPPKLIQQNDGNCSLPIVFQILMFILYVICFVSLFKDHLELIGYGLFFVLNVIMSFGMLTNLNPSGNLNPSEDKNMDIGQLTYTVLFKMFNHIKTGWIQSSIITSIGLFALLPVVLGIVGYYAYLEPLQSTKILLGAEIAGFSVLWLSIVGYFFFDRKLKLTELGLNVWYNFHFQNTFGIIKNMFVFIFGIIAIILIAILGIIIAPVQFILYLVKDTGIWTGKIPISWTIIISLILLFAAFTMFLISLQNVHAKHKKMGIPTMPAFIAGGNGEVKTGYTWKMEKSGNKVAPKGTGYYLNRGSGVNFFFSKTLVQNYATDFKIISITTVLLIWIQYLMFTNRATITNILNVNAVNGFFILNGATIVSLSSVCVWLTQRIGTLTNSIRAPPRLT